MSGDIVPALEAVQIQTLAARSGIAAEQFAKHNVLVVGDYVRQISEAHRVTVEQLVVQMPTKNERGYWINGSSPDLYQEGGKLAPTKHLLERIALKAGIRWDTAASGPVGGYHPDHAAFKMVGAIRGLNGEWMQVSRTKEWQLDVELLEINERAKVLTKGYGQKQRDATPEEKAAYVAGETARAKKHRMSMIETKAMNRVVKALVGLPSSGDEHYWSKPFLVPRIDVIIDAANPAVQDRLLNDAYGSRKFLGYDAGPPPTSVHGTVEPDGSVIVEEIRQGDEAVISELDREFPLPDNGGDHTVELPGIFQGQDIRTIWQLEGGPEYVRSLTKLPGGIADESCAAAHLWLDSKGERHGTT